MFVHGATYPAETAFDLALDGQSGWTSSRAAASMCSWWTFAGYGRSSRPLTMDAPPEENPPFGTTEEAVARLRRVVEQIHQTAPRRGAKLCLLGWSWGCATMGSFAALYPDLVERLVLFAPGWVREAPGGGPGRTGAWRLARVTRKRRWRAG